MPRIGLLLFLGLAMTTAGGPRPSTASTPSPGGLLLVANKGDHTLYIIDPQGGRPLVTVEESGVTGHEVIASPDGRTAYVPIYGDSGVGRPGTDGQTLDVIDIPSARRVTTIDLGRPERPHCPLFPNEGSDGGSSRGIASGTAPPPNGRSLLTPLLGVNGLGVLDLPSLQVSRTIAVPRAPQEVVVRPDGRFAYVSCDQSHQVAVVDLETWKVERLIEAGPLADGVAWAGPRPPAHAPEAVTRSEPPAHRPRRRRGPRSHD